MPQSKSFRREMIRRLIDLTVAAFGLVAALAWNDAITGIVKKYIPEGSTILAQLLYAIIVTLLAVLVTVEIGLLGEKLNPDEEEKNNGKKRHR